MKARGEVKEYKTTKGEASFSVSTGGIVMNATIMKGYSRMYMIFPKMLFSEKGISCSSSTSTSFTIFLNSATLRVVFLCPLESILSF